MKSRNGQNHSIRQAKEVSEPKITVRRRHPLWVFLYSSPLSLYREQESSASYRKRGQTSAMVTVANNYWSASTYVPNPTNAWNVNFNNGNVNNNTKTNNNYVRCVSAGAWS